MSDDIQQLRDEWDETTLRKTLDRFGEREPEFNTESGIPAERIYTPPDIEVEYGRDLGFPGQYPFTRGVQPTSIPTQADAAATDATAAISRCFFCDERIATAHTATTVATQAVASESTAPAATQLLCRRNRRCRKHTLVGIKRPLAYPSSL